LSPRAHKPIRVMLHCISLPAHAPGRAAAWKRRAIPHRATRAAVRCAAVPADLEQALRSLQDAGLDAEVLQQRIELAEQLGAQLGANKVRGWGGTSSARSTGGRLAISHSLPTPIDSDGAHGLVHNQAASCCRPEGLG
jgi:hypothetical protein